jgi:hypothetical protein
MAYDRIASRLMGMNEKVWASHANPLSGWTRLATAPLWFCALWSVHWIGWWSLIPIVPLCLWTWLNPRIFPQPVDDRAWMTRGVLGERIFCRRDECDIPAEHIRFAHILTFFAVISLISAVWGLLSGRFWPALGGWLLMITFKLWFIDRMAWLYHTMKDTGASVGSIGAAHR